MSIPAHIVIVTQQPVDRYEIITDGSVYFDANNTSFIEYQQDNSSVKIGIADDTITISNFGEDNYSMYAKEGACEPFVINGIPMTISTTLVKTSKTANNISANLEYYFSHKGERIKELEFVITISVTY